MEKASSQNFTREYTVVVYTHILFRLLNFKNDLATLVMVITNPDIGEKINPSVCLRKHT